ncbi:MAG: cupredoxin domain-containing protein [Actinomycetota bacterium]
MHRYVRLVPAIVGLALVAAACGGGTTDAGRETPTPTETAETPTPTDTGTTDGGAVELEVEAEDFAFDEATYTVPAGATVDLKFKNRDEGVPHTFSVYTSDDTQDEIFDTGNVIGDADESFQFQAPEAGTYYFQCDVHPNMNGDFMTE